MGKTITAEDIIGAPHLYNLPWRIGRGKVTWDCTGSNREGTKVRFARLVPDEGGVRQMTCYVLPTQEMHTDEDTTDEWDVLG